MVAKKTPAKKMPPMPKKDVQATPVPAKKAASTSSQNKGLSATMLRNTFAAAQRAAAKASTPIYKKAEQDVYKRKSLAEAQKVWARGGAAGDKAWAEAHKAVFSGKSAPKKKK